MANQSGKVHRSTRPSLAAQVRALAARVGSLELKLDEATASTTGRARAAASRETDMAFSTSTVESAEPSFVAARAPRGPSDRAVNADIAAVSALARDVYGRMGEAWMRSRNPGLGGKTPVDVIGEGRTPEVRDLLERIRDTVEA